MKTRTRLPDVACTSCGHTGPYPAFIQSRPGHAAGGGYRPVLVCADRDNCRRRAYDAELNLFAGRPVRYTVAYSPSLDVRVAARRVKVAELVARGRSSAVIAARLGVSPDTIHLDRKVLREQQAATPIEPAA